MPQSAGEQCTRPAGPIAGALHSVTIDAALVGGVTNVYELDINDTQIMTNSGGGYYVRLLVGARI